MEIPTPPSTPIICRGYLKHDLVFEYGADILDVSSIGVEHVQKLIAGEIDMVEIEIMGLPEDERYFRIGFNPDGMVVPVVLEDFRFGR